MSKLVYIIFLLPITSLVAMEKKEVSIAHAKQVITVANILKQGVVAQVDEAPEIWIRKETVGLIVVLPPQLPRLTHMLTVQDTNKERTLGQICFAHNEPKVFMVHRSNQEESNVGVREVTHDDLPAYGPQPAESIKFRESRELREFVESEQLKKIDKEVAKLQKHCQ